MKQIREQHSSSFIDNLRKKISQIYAIIKKSLHDYDNLG